MTLVMLVSVFSSIALWGLLFSSGLWAYRKFHFQSLPWIAAFLILTFILTFTAHWYNQYFMDHAPKGIQNAAQFFGYTGSLGNLVAMFSYLGRVISNLTYLMLALLVLSDIANLFLKSGIDITDTFGQRLVSLGQKSTILGIIMLTLKLMPTAIYIIIYNFR